MATIREAGGKWWMEIDGTGVPLQKDLPMRVSGSAVTYKEKPPETPEFILCRVVDWEYQVRTAEDASLVLIVEEPKPAITDNRAMAAMAVAGISFAALAIELHACYLHPEYAWGDFGYWARPVGCVLLALLFAVILPSRIGLRKSTGFREMFLTAILIWTGIVLIFLWFSLTRAVPSSAPGAGTDYAATGHAIAEKLRAHNWPFVIAALPWAAVVFKLFGFEVAEKATTVVLDATKKKD